MNYFGGMESQDIFIHPSSVVDPGALVGEGTRIWHFSHLSPTCVVGKNCTIGQNVFIGDKVIVGKGVKIQNNVSLYTGVEIGDDVFLGPSMVFTNVTNPRSFIERKNEFRKTLVRRGASIGANATILCGIEIGAYAMIGAGAVVLRDVPAHALVVGNPARQIGWVSEAGITLEFSAEGLAVCPRSGKTFKIQDNVLTHVE